MNWRDDYFLGESNPYSKDWLYGKFTEPKMRNAVKVLDAIPTITINDLVEGEMFRYEDNNKENVYMKLGPNNGDLAVLLTNGNKYVISPNARLNRVSLVQISRPIC